MGIGDFLVKTALLGFIKDQKIKEIVTKREFRFSEEYLHGELVKRAGARKVNDLSLKIYDGYAQITGRVKQWPMPVPMPFLVRLGVHGTEFSSGSKNVFLRIDEVIPEDGELLIGQLTEKIPCLTYHKGMVVCNLAQVPRLGDLFGYRVKGIQVMDYVTVKELALNKGELVARLGVRL